MSNINVRIYTDGLRYAIAHKCGSKEIRRLELNLAREIELARLKRRQGGETYRNLNNKEAEAVRIKYAQKADALMQRGLIESY